MKTTFKNFAFVALMVLCLSIVFTFRAQAQPITLNSGTKNLTYDTVMNQLLAVCAPEGNITNRNQPGGSSATISDILANKTHGGIVQYDVLWLRANTKSTADAKLEDLSSIKVLTPLHKEQVHVIALNKTLKVGGNWIGYGSEKRDLVNVRSLRGLTIAAPGGSAFTADTISRLANLNFNVKNDYTNQADALKAVREGNVPAALFVGGAPMELISGLNKDFRILPFDGETIKALEGIYTSKAVTYENLGSGSVETVQTPALLVVNDYKSTKISAALLKLRQCLKDNIDDFKETTGNHPAWRTVNLNDVPPKWDSYVGKQ